ncbi:MAG: ATP-binding cassette domain-containing protein [Mycobacteriales bacterium]
MLRNASGRGRNASTTLIAGVVALAVVLLLPVLPVINLKESDLSILVTTLAIAIAALGLDLLVGQTGQLSLAHAAFLGVGCFTAINIGSRGPWPLAFVGAIVVTAAAATIAGLPSLRIRGLQIAITTLAFQTFAEAFLFQRTDVTASGRSLEQPSYLHSFRSLYYFALGCVAVVVLVLRRVRATRSGRSFVAVRDIEARSQSFGIEPGRTKLLAYALSGAIVGLGGALFALKETSVNTLDNFNLQSSLILVAIVVVGGARSSIGILIAAVFVRALPSLLANHGLQGRITSSLTLTDLLPIVLAGLLVVAIVRQPEGIGGVLRLAAARIDRMRYGGSERPSPRPQPTDAVAAAHRSAELRAVPRPLRSRLPVPALLVARDLSVIYGGVHALEGVSLEVRRGEVVGLIGANGAGKSTFFNAVSGLAPVQGSITYRGRELTVAPPAIRSSTGLARTWQDMGLVRANTVRDNVLLAQTWMARYPAAAGILGLVGTVPTEAALRRRAAVALELFGLAHLADEQLGGLPYGTMRIAEIASAVAAGPDLLLLDEASAGLTPEEAHQLGDRFLALRDELGLTLVVIEHHVPLIARVCDYCYCLESGKLIAEGSPDAVTAEPAVIESFLGRGALTKVTA